MPRHNQRDERRRRRQKAKGMKRPRGWHRNHLSPGIREANTFLDDQRDRRAA